MKKKMILLSVILAALILEILPYGAVLNFGNPEGEPLRQTYSYFSLTPYGFANFGPLITAILTCVLLVLIILAIILKKNWSKQIAVISAVAAVISLSPLLFGIENFSIVGALISVCLAALFAIAKFSK